MIKEEANIFGLLFLGDGDKISRSPLLNIVDSGEKIPVAVFEIVDCQVGLADGGKNTHHSYVVYCWIIQKILTQKRHYQI